MSNAHTPADRDLAGEGHVIWELPIGAMTTRSPPARRSGRRGRAPPRPPVRWWHGDEAAGDDEEEDPRDEGGRPWEGAAGATAVPAALLQRQQTSI